MSSKGEQIRAAIAEEAGEWFVANEEGPLDAPDSAALAAWLKTSPLHVEEFLGVSVIARDLKEARTDPQYSIEAILGRAREEGGAAVQPFWPRVVKAARHRPRRWLPLAVTIAACTLLSLGALLTWKFGLTHHSPPAEGVAAMYFRTGHGEQLTHRLADDSVLHLDTDSAVTIRYSSNERLVTLIAGQADFEVTHDPDRAFRVLAGSVEVRDLGTKFDVRLEKDQTVITVVEGRVAVGLSPNQSDAPRFVQLSMGQQLRVTEGEWPATPVLVDAQSATSWLRREIVFDHEPLEKVAAEYNRYAVKPIEIATPALRSLQITGVFATNDSEAFIAFLRSLKGVRVEVTETRIRVWRD